MCVQPKYRSWRTAWWVGESLQGLPGMSLCSKVLCRWHLPTQKPQECRQHQSVVKRTCTSNSIMLGMSRWVWAADSHGVVLLGEAWC